MTLKLSVLLLKCSFHVLHVCDEVHCTVAVEGVAGEVSAVVADSAEGLY